MNLLILYESCTGNTALGVEIIRQALEKDGHRCEVRRFRDADPAELEGFDLYCFATPVQSFAPLASVHRFIREMPKLRGRPAFIFTTCAGWPGAAHRLMAAAMRRKGMIVLGARTLACPDSWPIGRRIDRFFYDHVSFPRRRSAKKACAFALEMVNRAYRHRDGIRVRQAPHLLWPTPTLPLGLAAVRGMLSRGFGKRSVDAEACTRCGVCVEACPVGAVSLDGESGLPAFSRDCIGCWACFNNCPERAILSSACRPEHYYGGIRKKRGAISGLDRVPTFRGR
ncbi:MAG: 4Fe-4S binding protein [Actinobacteria bacterium]|nr:4Fe-4S binding protein [Actinomycetota bacterium]MDI6830627.1 EFR1 family ferrodoxin [Actinomycetota bacterium]